MGKGGARVKQTAKKAKRLTDSEPILVPRSEIIEVESFETMATEKRATKGQRG